MVTGKVLYGKLYAGNPYVRFDDEEVAPTTTPRRGSLPYKNVIKCTSCFLLMMGFAAAGCSNDSSHESGDGDIMSRVEKHKKVQLWKNGPYWAETNIGAENPWDFGYYFWWGDTVGYKRVNDAWVASDGTSADFSFDSKHTSTDDKYEVDLLKEGWVKDTRFSLYTYYLSPEHDAAHVHWGGEWRMPTERELSDLVRECDWTWTEIKGVGGYVVRGKGTYATAGIFLPAAGHGDGKSHRSGGWAGDYWSSVPSGVGDAFAVALFFFSDRYNTSAFSGRDNGYPIRPVQGFTNVKESGKNEKAVLDLCKYVAGRETGLASIEQIEEFRGSKDRTTRYAAFHEAMTSAGIPDAVSVSELAKFVFNMGRGSVAYDAADVGGVKSRVPGCRKIRKALSSGWVTDSRIARYLIAFLSATPDNAAKFVTDCPAFIELHDLVSDFAKETVAEAEDAGTIFTDGQLDDEMRDEIKRRSLSIELRSMMGSPVPSETFLEKMKTGAAAQMGSEILSKRGEATTALQVSGALFRQNGMSDNVRLKGVKSAEKLADRILCLYERNAVDTLMDKEMKDKLLFVQWRIARIARIRAEQERQQGLIEQSKRSAEVADRLDKYNSALKKMQQELASRREKKENALSPKERLKLALGRADFEKAQKDAKIILETEPDDLNANFAMGMLFLSRKQWEGAEKHLLKCKVARPDDAAIWNNLAMVYLHMKRYDDAKAHVKKALSLAPDSEDVKDTVKQVEEVISCQSIEAVKKYSDFSTEI